MEKNGQKCLKGCISHAKGLKYLLYIRRSSSVSLHSSVHPLFSICSFKFGCDSACRINSGATMCKAIVSLQCTQMLEHLTRVSWRLTYLKTSKNISTGKSLIPTVFILDIFGVLTLLWYRSNPSEEIWRSLFLISTPANFHVVIFRVTIRFLKNAQKMAKNARFFPNTQM